MHKSLHETYLAPEACKRLAVASGFTELWKTLAKKKSDTEPYKFNKKIGARPRKTRTAQISAMSEGEKGAPPARHQVRRQPPVISYTTQIVGHRETKQKRAGAPAGKAPRRPVHQTSTFHETKRYALAINPNLHYAFPEHHGRLGCCCYWWWWWRSNRGEYDKQTTLRTQSARAIVAENTRLVHHTQRRRSGIARVPE